MDKKYTAAISFLKQAGHTVLFREKVLYRENEERPPICDCVTCGYSFEKLTVPVRLLTRWRSSYTGLYVLIGKPNVIVTSVTNL